MKKMIQLGLALVFVSLILPADARNLEIYNISDTSQAYLLVNRRCRT